MMTLSSYYHYKKNNRKCNLNYRIRNIFHLLLAAVLCPVLLAGCGRQPEPLRASEYKLDTIVTLTVYDRADPALLKEALSLCDYYEGIFSRTDGDSELYRLNQAAHAQALSGYPLSGELYGLIEKGLAYSALSEGAFDITLEPLTSLWDFTGGSGVPDAASIEGALPSTGYRNVTLSEGAISTARSGMGFDLGAIAKGYIADRMKEFLLDHGVKHAVISLGGNVVCIGGRADGDSFRVGVRQPFADSKDPAAMLLNIKDLSVVTSGIYERYFEEDGILYHHLLDPSTGYPYQNGIASVTILSEESVDGDALSTVCYALGPERGLSLINSLPGTEAAYIMEDGSITMSGGFSEYAQ